VKVLSIRDLAAAVRGRRKDLGLSQAELAARSGVSRKWVYEFEGGKSTAELRLVLRVVDALSLTLDLGSGESAPTPEADRVDLDALLDKHRTE
jgi:y4mF family transcriptional regulator